MSVAFKCRRAIEQELEACPSSFWSRSDHSGWVTDYLMDSFLLRQSSD